MSQVEHTHKWEVLKGSNKLICNLNGCETVTEIHVLLANTVIETKKATKHELLSAQLFARELRKDARDAAYSWVMANGPETNKQEILL
jgi:hypothetical protein